MMGDEEKSRLISQIRQDANISLRKMSDARENFYNRVIRGIEQLPEDESREKVRLKLRNLQNEVMNSIGSLRDYCANKEFTDYLKSQTP